MMAYLVVAGMILVIGFGMVTSIYGWLIGSILNRLDNLEEEIKVYRIVKEATLKEGDDT